MKSKNNEIREHTANMQADTTGDVFTLDLEDGSGCQDWEPVTNKQKEKKKTLSASGMLERESNKVRVSAPTNQNLK